MQMCLYFMKILAIYALNSHLLTLKAHVTKSRMLLSSSEIFEAPSTSSVDPDQTAPVGSLIWVHNACLYNYVNQ